MSSNTQQTILVTAASGHIGNCLIPLLLNDPSQPKIILPTTNAAKLASTLPSPTPSQITIEEGSIQDPSWMQQILTTHNVTSVFLCLTGDNELMVTLNIFDAMLKCPSIKHLVYLSACGDFSLQAITDNHLLRDVSAGHVVVKFILEAKLRYGLPAPSSSGGPGFTHTIIGPTLFFDNDLRCKTSLLEKQWFDEPIGTKGVSRVAPADIALAVYTSLVKDQGRNYHGQKIMVGSRQLYTSKDIAALWSKNLGKQIKAQGSDSASLDGFEEHFKRFKGPGWARDMRLMYEIFETRGFGMTQEEYDTQVKFLGKEPESYEEFVENAARGWLKE